MNYYPVLKWKAGEKTALTKLSDEQKDRVKPIIEIVDPCTAESFIHDIADYPNTVYVDTILCDEDRQLLLDITRQARGNDINILPVLYYYDIANPDPTLIKTIQGCGIKIPTIDAVDGPTQQEVIAAVKNIREPLGPITAILDVGEATNSQYINSTKLLRSGKGKEHPCAA